MIALGTLPSKSVVYTGSVLCPEHLTQHRAFAIQIRSSGFAAQVNESVTAFFKNLLVLPVRNSTETLGMFLLGILMVEIREKLKYGDIGPTN